MKARHLVLAMAVVNAALYACLVPLWEGFDEPLHYGYVQNLSVRQQIPVFGQTAVSAEIWRSLQLTPLSWLLSESLGCCTSFADWARLPHDARVRRLQERDTLGVALRSQSSQLANWEAQQAPLAYFALAPLDRLFNSFSLPARVLALRLACAWSALALIYCSLNWMLRRLSVPEGFRLGALACVFGAQMLWATVAHVANDFLAVGLACCFIALLLPEPAKGSSRLWPLACVLSLGLLTKAYFLAFVPVFIAFAVSQWVRKRADWKTAVCALLLPLLIDGPWYARNLALYQSLTGTQQALAGIGLFEVIAAIPRIPWITSVHSYVRWSLWTGNWSFVSFSRTTLDLEALFLCAAFVLFLIGCTRSREWPVWALVALGSFVAGIAYQSCATWLHTGGHSLHAEPWYAQTIIPCVWVLCFSGAAVNGLLGRIVAIALSIVSAWIAALTYVFKLLPLYGGGPYARSNAGDLWRWWLSGVTDKLQGVLLAPTWVLFTLLLLFTVLLVWVTALSVMKITRF